MSRREKAPERRPADPAVIECGGGSPAHQLIESCQGLVRSLAWKIHQKLPANVDLDDLIAFGQVGLAEAARDFDPDRGGKFTTYAYYRIRGSIFDGLSKMNWFKLRDYHGSRYERMAGEVLALEAGESAEAAAASVEQDAGWLKGLTGKLAVVYLATGGGREEEEGGRSGEGSLVDESSPSPLAQAIEGELRDLLDGLIDALPADAGSLIRGVYFEGLTLKEAGERIGISKAWASRLHTRTLQRLAGALRLLGAAG